MAALPLTRRRHGRGGAQWVSRPLILVWLAALLQRGERSSATAAFVAPSRIPRHLLLSSQPKTLLLSMPPNNNNEEWDIRDPKSQLYGYISNYLRKEQQENETQSADGFSHLIAIPLDSCNELLLELESVQRAVLYHCPILVHACITQAMTRLPLLYARPLAPMMAATEQLHEILSRVVDQCLFTTASDSDEEGAPASQDDVKRDDGVPDLAGANADGIEPLLMAFETLEIDGSGNDVLLTVAKPNHPGTVRLVRMVNELRQELAEAGWETVFPPDPEGGSLRLRIPFMRLPSEWNSILESNDAREEGGDSSEQFRTSDQGGNGISPILWGKWMDDTFGGDQTRLSEIAIYRRQNGKAGLAEDAFYLPARSIPLPAANEALARVEAQFKEYQQQRMEQAEEELQNEKDQNGETDSAPFTEDDFVFAKTRERLESLYDDDDMDSVAEEKAEVSASDGEEEEDATGDDDYQKLNLDSGVNPGNAAELDKWTQQRIRQAIESRARVQSERKQLQKRIEDKPPISENVVFSKYKDGTLAPQPEVSNKPPELPPFPSREYGVGFWRMLDSPTGFDVEEGDASRSDNIVLRVDGTTAGGPILDQETRQKASGGTWRLSGSTPNDARLRIRLVIPPKKERILVMEGQLSRVSMSMSSLPLAKRTFSLPLLEAKAEQAAAADADSNLEDLLYCSGQVSIEDAVTGDNCQQIGKFSIMKLNTPSNPGDFTITIPKPVRNQD